ncbi:MAG: di-trans,poly-cis-decaprenylcistransferase [Candidatus Micrarchaeota archaeon]|nr:di-trans,poly-cis-decaprenylcistransferase [Candidatus Micrarchaeota archaeon]
MTLASRERVPSHIALIPDGNRRWSRMQGLSIMNGYQNGVAKFISFSIWAKSMGVRTLTVWALSTENVRNRSRIELSTLYGLYMKAAKDPKLLALLVKNRARVRFIGDMQLIPSTLRKALTDLEERTRTYKDLTINLLIGYGGRDDLVYAASRGASSEDDFSRKIRTASIPNVDLIIRTSGERRLSGFLPWQTDYSEIYFSRKFWPDFQRRDLKRAVDSYTARERRFGK